MRLKSSASLLLLLLYISKGQEAFESSRPHLMSQFVAVHLLIYHRCVAR